MQYRRDAAGRRGTPAPGGRRLGQWTGGEHDGRTARFAVRICDPVPRSGDRRGYRRGDTFRPADQGARCASRERDQRRHHVGRRAIRLAWRPQPTAANIHAGRGQLPADRGQCGRHGDRARARRGTAAPHQSRTQRAQHDQPGAGPDHRRVRLAATDLPGHHRGGRISAVLGRVRRAGCRPIGSRHRAGRIRRRLPAGGEHHMGRYHTWPRPDGRLHPHRQDADREEHRRRSDARAVAVGSRETWLRFKHRDSAAVRGGAVRRADDLFLGNRCIRG